MTRKRKALAERARALRLGLDSRAAGLGGWLWHWWVVTMPDPVYPVTWEAHAGNTLDEVGRFLARLEREVTP